MLELIRRKKSMAIEKPTELKPHAGPGFAGRPDLSEDGIGQIQRRQHDYAPTRIRDLSTERTYDMVDEEPRRVKIDLNLEEPEEPAVSNLNKMRKLLLSLTFGEKMEMSDGVAGFQKSDSFTLAMCLHRWAKGESPESSRHQENKETS